MEDDGARGLGHLHELFQKTNEKEKKQCRGLFQIFLQSL